jgi:PAS domain-containing protein
MATATETTPEVNLEVGVEAWNWTTVAELAPIGIFRTTPKKGLAYVNKHFAKIFDFDSPDDMRQKVKDIAEDLLVIPPELEAKRVVPNFEFHAKTSKGNRKLSLTIRLAGSGKETFFEGFLSDVTEYEDASRLEELLRDVQGMAYKCELKPPWRMLRVSAGCGELTGYSKEDLEASKPAYEELIYKEYRAEVKKAVDEGVRTKTTFAMTYPIRTGGNEERWVFEKGRAEYGEDGKPLYLEGFITNSNKVVAHERLNLERKDHLQQMSLRNLFAWAFIVQFTIVNFVILALAIMKVEQIGETTLLGFFMATVAELTGLVYLMAKYVFPSKDRKRPSEEPPAHSEEETSEQEGAEAAEEKEDDEDGKPPDDFKDAKADSKNIKAKVKPK